MGAFGSFYKGEKKKQKKKSETTMSGNISTRPVFTEPRLVEKKRKAA